MKLLDRLVMLPLFRSHYAPYIGMCLGVLTLIGCGHQINKVQNFRAMPQKYVNGSFVVELNQSADAAATLTDLKARAANAAKKYGCEVGEPEKVQWETSSSGVIAEGMAQTYHVQFNNCTLEKESTISVMDGLAKAQGVANVEANAMAESFEVAYTENDPYRSRQYYLDTIKRDEACKALGKKNQRPVIVAVVDSGVDRSHPDLQDAFLRDASGRVVGANFVAKGASSPADDSWDDQNGHGTHVAGLIAATSNNNTGIAGVSSCANVKIMPVRAMDANGAGNNMEINRAIVWASEHGADVINLSLGGMVSTDSPQESFPNTMYETLAKRGVIVFAAAGNDGFRNGSRTGNGYTYSIPSSYNNVIAVAATDENGRLASFSNRGELVDIAAPGVQDFSTYPGTYKALSGTSMATPVAVGTFALAYASVIDNMSQRIRNAQPIMSSATVSRLSTSDVAAGGVIDASGILQKMMAQYGSSKKPSTPVNAPDAEAPATPTPTQPSQPTQPTTPKPTTPVVSKMSFVGLKANQQLYSAVEIAVTNLPPQTAAVYFYWGKGGANIESFELVEVGIGSSLAVVPSRYYLLGNKTLYAEAVDSNGERLQVISLPLQGF